MHTECHASFKQDVWSGLRRQVDLVILIVRGSECIAELSNIVRREKDNNRLCLLEGGVENLSNVGGGFSGFGNQLTPLQWLETNLPEEPEHRISRLEVPSMNDHDGARISCLLWGSAVHRGRGHTWLV